MFFVNDEMIEFSEKLLLPDGAKSNEERRNIIRCMETKDIQACPGSGKTTTLLAKLCILARQMPLPSNQGICVLTHTNVAVDEIRNKLQGYTDILFQYPNHFGTIQSFVNRYLAIPAYIEMFGKKPARIDDDFFNEYTVRNAGRLDYGAKFWLDKQYISLQQLRFNKDNFDISKQFDGPILLKPDSKSYPLIYQFKLGILREGVICYADAYSLAYYYLRKYPEIKDIISERFSYIFIDEMQDTDNRQNDLLERCFDSTRVIVQRIGDLNQAIYESPSEIGWVPRGDVLTIAESKRFSNEIAAKIKNTCLVPQELVGNDLIPNISPKIIVFSDDTITKVLPKFGELIFDHGLHEQTGNVFKAVGGVGQAKDKRTIPSYFQSYGLPDIKKKQDFESLIDYILMALRDKSDSVKTKQILIYRGILKSLRILGVKRDNNLPYSQDSLSIFLKTKHELFYEDLKARIITWCMQLHNGINVYEDVKSFIASDICHLFGKKSTISLNSFLNGPSLIQDHSEITRTNIYLHERDGHKIPIQLSTVHSVKGETHTATLYLETFYRKYDVEILMDYMKGKHVPPKLETVSHALKLAYVGMSRPTHLLCVAAHLNGCMEHLSELESVGWDIVRI